MTKFGSAIIAFLFILGVVYFVAKPMREEQVFGTVVIATEDIPHGTIVKSTSFESVPEEQNNIPSGAIAFIADIAGKKSRFDIAEGQIVSIVDFEPPLTKIRMNVISAAKDIPAGKELSRQDLKTSVKSIKYVPNTFIFSQNQCYGMKLKKQKSRDEIIHISDIW